MTKDVRLSDLKGNEKRLVEFFYHGLRIIESNVRLNNNFTEKERNNALIICASIFYPDLQIINQKIEATVQTIKERQKAGKINFNEAVELLQLLK